MIFPSHNRPFPRGDSLARLMERVSGSGATIVPYGTETPFCQKLGMMPLVLGPGSVRPAHTSGESVSLDSREALRICNELTDSVRL